MSTSPGSDVALGKTPWLETNSTIEVTLTNHSVVSDVLTSLPEDVGMLRLFLVSALPVPGKHTPSPAGSSHGPATLIINDLP